VPESIDRERNAFWNQNGEIIRGDEPPHHTLVNAEGEVMVYEPKTPAKPTPSEQPTLRDLFAMHAMSALIQKLSAWQPDGHEGGGGVPGPLYEWLGTHGGDQEEIASNAYEIADAMLRAREAKP
jgi:hypothetical protein